MRWNQANGGRSTLRGSAGKRAVPALTGPSHPGCDVRHPGRPGTAVLRAPHGRLKRHRRALTDSRRRQWGWHPWEGPFPHRGQSISPAAPAGVSAILLSGASHSLRRPGRTFAGMATPRIIWTVDKYGDCTAFFEGCPRELVHVSQPITKDRWNLHLCVIVPWQRSWHHYASKEKAMAHAELWLASRHRRVLDDMPKPFPRPDAPVYVRNPEADIPHPGGRKRVYKARRKPF